MIVLQNTSIQRDGAQVINNVSLKVWPGQVVSLIGPNGAGKSSVLQAIGGLIPISSGALTVQLKSGDELLSLPVSTKAKTLASLPQHNPINFAYSAQEVVALGRYPHSTGVDVDASIVQKVMVLLDVQHLAKRNILSLSGGEQQRVHLARVIAQIWPLNPADSSQNILLLDEPATSLDLGHKQKLFSVIQSLASSGVTIIIAEHDVNMALRFSDAVGVLKRGALVAFGKPNDIITPRLLGEVFDANVHTFMSSGGSQQLGI